ncbi:MAG TPA: DUF3987 domain-containing protein [Pirellulales bacterium]|nr:DUF3987 domain-containing protein [Pirellulales bacterium]
MTRHTNPAGNGHCRTGTQAPFGQHAREERPLPKDLDAEKAVIGSVMIDPSCMGAVVNLLSPDDFFLPAHRQLFEVLIELHFEGSPIGDLTILVAAFEARGCLSDVGGKAFLAELLCETATAKHAMLYAQSVSTNALLRGLVAAGGEITGLGYAGGEAADLPWIKQRAFAVLTKAIESTELARDNDQPLPPGWTPFPLECLPRAMRDYVASAAEAVDCDASMVALPSLSVAASAIGNTRRAALKASWIEPSILWTAVIAPVGTAKSAAIAAAIDPVRQCQAELAQQYELGKPSRRIFASDLTIEALAGIVGECPRGLLVGRDELSAWLQGMQRYHQHGSDSGQWLELHTGTALVVDRRAKDRPPVRVEHPAVSITGAIQPEILRRCLGSEHLVDGLAQRLLWAMPPTRAQRWTEATISSEVRVAWRNTLDGLWKLESCRADKGEFPRTVPLSGAAKRAYVAWHEVQRVRQEGIAGPLLGSLAKMPGACARLAMILHLAAAAGGEVDNASEIGSAAMDSAIRIIEWCCAEQRRVYAMLDATGAERAENELLEIIARKGGRITQRELCHAARKYRGKGAAFEALNQLVGQGEGVWESPRAATGRGRPAQPVFVLIGAPTVT